MTNQAKNIFDGDALNRLEFAEGIYRLVHRLRKGVIAIDGDWGVGKSWFGIHLKKLIECEDEFRAMWIDAFEADWDDDPVLTLIAVIASELPDEDRQNFFNSISPLVAKAIPSAVKLTAKVAAKIAGVNEDLADGIGEIFKDSGEEVIRKKLDELATRKKTLEYLKSSISACVAKSKGAKVVVFVDELDRCSPAYAVRLLERLKHLFDIDGVVFILLWHRRQISKAVEAFYGSGTDGAMYLDKFVDYPLSLSVSSIRANEMPMQRLLMEMRKEFPDGQSLQLDENMNWLNAVSGMISLNARQAKRLAKWWVISETRSFCLLETWLLGIKAKVPEVYAGLRNGEKIAHQSAIDQLSHVGTKHPSYRIARMLIKYHQCYATDKFDEQDAELAKFCTSFGVALSESLNVAIRHIEATID